MIVIGSDPEHPVARMGVLETFGEQSAFLGAIAPSPTIRKIGTTHVITHEYSVRQHNIGPMFPPDSSFATDPILKHVELNK